MFELFERRVNQAQREWHAAIAQTVVNKDAIIEELRGKLQILTEDFKYNLSLFKMRESELLQSRTENQNLHRLLDERNDEIKRSSAQISSLKETLNSIQTQYRKNKVVTEKVRIAFDNIQTKLNSNLTQKNSLESISKQRKCEIDKLQLQCEKEREIIQKLRMELQSAYKAYEEIERKSISLDNNTVKNIASLELQVRVLKDENSVLKLELLKFDSIKEKYESGLEMLNREKNQLLIEIKNSNRQENFNWKNEISDLKDIIEQLKTENIELKNINVGIKTELEVLIKEQKEFIFVTEKLKNERDKNNNEYEKIIKQNEVLKDVIRGLRKEKTHNEVKEKQIDELENKVRLLKEAMIKNLNGNLTWNK